MGSRPALREAKFAEALPSILGGLLDLAVEVRAQQADVPADLRMADFARMCTQLDAVHHLGALAAYRASLDDLTDDVIEGDPLAQVVIRYAASEHMNEQGGAGRMSSAEWLSALNRYEFGE